MHDFIYSLCISQFYYYMFYLFSEGPMKLVSYIAAVHTLLSFFFGIMSIRFKFSLTKILVTLKYSTYKSYFYFKLLYTLVSFILNLYYVAVFQYRLRLHIKNTSKIIESRREMSDRVNVQKNFGLMAVVFFINSFHLLQNFYWIKLLNVSFIDLMSRVKEGEIKGK
jgi:hypothetical protein